MQEFENIGLSTPWIVGLSITAGFVGIALLLLVGWALHHIIWRALNRNRHWNSWEAPDLSPWWGISIIAGICAVLIGIGQIILAVPFQEKYLNWYTIEGTVTSVEGVLDTQGKYVNNEYVVTLDSTDVPLMMDDTRILTQEGNRVTLLCGVAWVNYGNSADRYTCSIRDAEYTE